MQQSTNQILQLITMSPKPSTRWCPTPGQLMTLEELYRRGLRTPNTSQIQKITTHLAIYGKIQYKNVFYWFQNHKARDRQKMRKNLAKMLQQQHLTYAAALYQPHNNLDYYRAAPLFNHHLATCEEAPKHANWRSFLSKDWTISTGPYVGPCSRSGPPQTLELFPLEPDHKLTSQTAV